MNATPDARAANERRIARMGVWIDLAENTPADDHVRFVFYWVAYEAGYQVRLSGSDSLRLQQEDSRRRRPSPRNEFHRRVARHDAGGLQQILAKHKRRISALLELRQAHPSFWEPWPEDWDVRTRADWETRFRSRVNEDLDQLALAIRRGASRDVAGALDDLFRRLSVVRNQIVHGGSAGLRSRGRTQVRLGAGLLEDFVPRFRYGIERHLDENWGLPPFPRVGDEADEKCLPPWL